MSKIIRRFYIDSVLTNMTSVELEDPTDTYGVKRDDTDAVVVASGTAMTLISPGIYEHEFTDPAFNLTYTYYLKVVYSGETYYIENTFDGPSDSTAVETSSEAIDYVERMLGAPTVCVELTDNQLQDAVNNALRLFNRYMMIFRNNVSWSLSPGEESEVIGEAIGVAGSRRYNGSLNYSPVEAGSIRFTDGTQVVTDDGGGTLSGDVDITATRTIDYTLGIYDFTFTAVTADAVTINYEATSRNVGSVTVDMPIGCLGVHYVHFLEPRSSRITAQMTVYEIMYRMVYPPMELGVWYMMRSFYEMYQRIRGTEPDWKYDEESNKLYLDCWSGPYDVFYVTSHLLTEDDLLSGSRERYKQLFLDACLAYAMQTLSFVRGKWNGTIPIPGGNLATDAPDLRKFSADTLLRVENTLKKRMRAYYLPVTG